MHLSGHSLINEKVQSSKSSLSSPALDEPQALVFRQQSSCVTKIVLTDYIFVKGARFGACLTLIPFLDVQTGWCWIKSSPGSRKAIVKPVLEQAAGQSAHGTARQEET